MLNPSILPQAISQGLAPPLGPDGKGPLALSANYNFANAAEIQDELTALEMAGAFPIAQAVYINNRANSNALTLTVHGTEISVTVPPASQAILPCLSTLPTRYTLATVQADINVRISFLNVPLPYLVWGTDADPSTDLAAILLALMQIETNTAGALFPLATISTATVALNANQRGAYTDLSGIIAAADTWQQVAAANLARKKFFLTVQNGAAASMFIFFGAVPPANGVYDGAFELTQGSTWTENPPCSTDIIWIQSTSNAASQKFTAVEM